MIYIIGDIHGDFSKIATLPPHSTVIICGDVALGWDSSTLFQQQKYLNILERRNIITYFIAGNHENYTFLSTFKSTSHLIYLPFNTTVKIQNKTFYCLGGAESIDREMRTPYKTWWPEEIPSRSLQYAALSEPHICDYIISHECPTKYKPVPPIRLSPRGEEYQCFLDQLERQIQYKIWFFGHHHIDKTFSTYTEKVGQCLYENFYKLKI